MLIAEALRGGDTFFQQRTGFFRAASGDQRLRPHLVSGDVVGILVENDLELAKGFVGLAALGVLQGEAVAREGVVGRLRKDFLQEREAVGHDVILA